MTTKKKPAENPAEPPTVTCGDCDSVWPEGTKVCPKCGYGIA